MARSGQKLLDLIDDLIRLPDPHDVIVPWQLDQLCARDTACDVAASANVDPAVARAMEDQSRDADRGQELSDVDPKGHFQHGTRGRGARAEPEILCPPAPELLVIRKARSP